MRETPGKGGGIFCLSIVMKHYWYQVLLSVLMILVAFLYRSVTRRWRKEESEWCTREKQWPGKGFDVSTIALNIQRVRERNPVMLHRRQARGFHHGVLLATARRWVGGLAYFQREDLGHEGERPD